MDEICFDVEFQPMIHQCLQGTPFQRNQKALKMIPDLTVRQMDFGNRASIKLTWTLQI